MENLKSNFGFVIIISTRLSLFKSRVDTVLSALFHVPVEAIDVSQHFHSSWKHAHIKNIGLSKFTTGVLKKLIR